MAGCGYGGPYDPDCDCGPCRWHKTDVLLARERASGWGQRMGGGDSAGNPITVAFGTSPKTEGHTLIGDGDRSEINFKDSANHDHYGSGNGPNNNGTRRGQYSGPGA